MDTLLLIVTVISLAAAFVSFLAVRKLKHNDQLRSDARVAALVAAADALPVHVEPPARRAAAPTTDGTWASVAGEWQWNPGTRAGGRGEVGRDLFQHEVSPDRHKSDVDRGPSRVLLTTSSQKADSKVDTADEPDSLFGTVRREQPGSGRFAVAAAVTLIVALGGAMAVFTSTGHEKVAPAARSAHPNPLELVALGHSRDAGSLTINGVVRNPSNGSKLEGLTAVVSLIDGHGGLVSTKDVPLDYRALGPGEEAPFKVTVPDPGSIARYRVSFRAGTDVVPHVDRRTDAKLASAL